MHIITRKRIQEAQACWPASKNALDEWYRVMRRAEVENFDQLRRLFNSVDKVGGLYVFNVGGNKLRLIAAIHFNRKRVYIRAVLTHQEYDRGAWKE